MRRDTVQTANPNSDAKLKGLNKRTFIAKTFACIVLTAMSIYVIVEYWTEMETSTNLFFKTLGCIFSFILLAPSVYDTFVMAWLLMSLFDGDVANKTHDNYIADINEEIEPWCFVLVMSGLIFCCPLSWSFVFYRWGCTYPVAGSVVGFVDVIQTLVLFPLTVVVIFTSESGIDIFVNIIAVQVFGNLDDIFAYAVTSRRSEILKKTSRLYLNWLGGEPKTHDYVDASTFNALSEKVLLIEKMMKPVDD